MYHEFYIAQEWVKFCFNTHFLIQYYISNEHKIIMNVSKLFFQGLKDAISTPNIIIECMEKFDYRNECICYDLFVRVRKIKSQKWNEDTFRLQQKWCDCPWNANVVQSIRYFIIMKSIFHQFVVNFCYFFYVFYVDRWVF